MFLWLPAVFFVLSMLSLLLVGFHLMWGVRSRKERHPFGEKLLRPAGESLRKRLEEINEEMACWLFLAMFGPTAYVALTVLLYRNMGGTTPPYYIWAISAIALAFLGFALCRLIPLVKKWRNCWLGFHGERAVAEEINQLMREGCHVFHDIPMDPYGNIDHVIVAASGIYAVETKTRRKRKAPKGKLDHEVIFDGKTLEFPHCRDAHGVEQACRNANLLRAMLTKAVGEPVKVTPILTFPGWFVTSRANVGIKVVNPKSIRHVVLSSHNDSLSPQLIERIAWQLDQKCRDVEL